MLSLRGLETFYWVANLGGFHSASEKLHTSQPAVSQRIVQLEQALGVRLFERDTRGVRLTARGQMLLGHAERMLQLRQDMLQLARADTALSGRLSIGVSETLVHTWLPELLRRVHLLYPELQLEIEVDNTHVLREHLLARRLDLTFLLGPLPDAPVENLPLSSYPLAWVAHASRDFGPEPVALARLMDGPIITYPATSAPHQAVRSMLAAAARAAGLGLPRMYGSASLSTIVRMVMLDIGVGVVTPLILERELAEGVVRVLSVAGPPLPELRFGAAWQRDNGNPSAAVVARMAAEVAQAC
ncbi:LysR family transcriptional regulator [Ottowia testudinis]|uniref:LysR family transcriptional regulator n=1 Tax=Ottowia testudinis TaxID=2816950 RepID=A0A975CKV9_9BURK|nr:LysR family transcriptional regulator [Ottowia testudinis]QTD45343.1 LysR family transcriptional regulator [Ottowia testudinis]